MITDALHSLAADDALMRRIFADGSTDAPDAVRPLVSPASDRAHLPIEVWYRDAGDAPRLWSNHRSGDAARRALRAGRRESPASFWLVCDTRVESPVELAGAPHVLATRPATPETAMRYTKSRQQRDTAAAERALGQVRATLDDASHRLSRPARRELLGLLRTEVATRLEAMAQEDADD